MNFASSLNSPLAATFRRFERANQSCVLVNANHAFAFLKLTLQTKDDRLPDPRDGIEVRDNKRSRDYPKPFLRSCQTEARHAPGEDHRASGAARIDRAP